MDFYGFYTGKIFAAYKYLGAPTEKQGVTEELKAQDQMERVRLMNNIKASAEEIVLKEIIYM